MSNVSQRGRNKRFPEINPNIIGNYRKPFIKTHLKIFFSKRRSAYYTIWSKYLITLNAHFNFPVL